jgi:hypothetical protein
MEEALMVTTLAQFQALSLVFAQYKFSPFANVFHFPQRQFGEGAQANKANFVNGFCKFLLRCSKSTKSTEALGPDEVQSKFSF